MVTCSVCLQTDKLFNVNVYACSLKNIFKGHLRREFVHDRVPSTLRASLSGIFLQTLPDLVTPLKGHSLSNITLLWTNLNKILIHDPRLIPLILMNAFALPHHTVKHNCIVNVERVPFFSFFFSFSFFNRQGFRCVGMCIKVVHGGSWLVGKRRQPFFGLSSDWRWPDL